jgi:putative heme iron utilization protein
MDNALAGKLRHLISRQTVASLGTLHSGAPYVSMVPFALLDDASAFVIHVSLLAAHTRDMLADPRVSLLVMDAPSENVPPQALPRISVAGTALQLSADSPAVSPAREAYLTRFPDSAPMFELGDFSLFVITPSSVRWIAGFGQALSLTPESFAKAAKSSE